MLPVLLLLTVVTTPLHFSDLKSLTTRETEASTCCVLHVTFRLCAVLIKCGAMQGRTISSSCRDERGGQPKVKSLHVTRYSRSDSEKNYTMFRNTRADKDEDFKRKNVSLFYFFRSLVMSCGDLQSVMRLHNKWHSQTLHGERSTSSILDLFPVGCTDQLSAKVCNYTPFFSCFLASLLLQKAITPKFTSGSTGGLNGPDLYSLLVHQENCRYSLGDPWNCSLDLSWRKEPLNCLPGLNQ